MTDMEKVIKGLECCLPMTTRNGLGDCENCPYDREITLEGGITECCHELMLEAHALLKAQEPRFPRVMTLDEINAVKQNDVLVYESNAAFKAIFHFIVAEGVVDNELRIKTEFERIDMAAPLKTYNRVWRCWTSRPTDEQREATSWNE
jgi:hypothetical protein